MSDKELAPLFRSEVVAAQQDRAFGTAIIVQPVSTVVLTIVSVLVAVGIGVFVARAEYTRKAHVNGYVVPSLGLIKIYSLETGTIVEKRVAEGSRVSKGDVLFVISMERSNGETTEAQASAMGTLRQRRESLTRQLEQQQQAAQIDAGGLHTQIDAVEAELARIAEEVKTYQSRVDSARRVLDMYEQLLTRQLASPVQREEQQRAVLTEQSSLEALLRSQTALAAQRDALRAQAAALEVKAPTEREGTQREIAGIDQALTEYESRRTFVVTAPADGTATTVLAEAGQIANPAQPLMSLLPSGAVLQAHLLVPSQSIGFIAQGQDVAIRYQAFPYQRFGSYEGRVTEVSRTLILPGETAVPFALTEPAYRIVVALDSQSVTAYGRHFDLEPGMQLDANISLDRRKLYQWLLDPLYSLRGNL